MIFGRDPSALGGEPQSKGRAVGSGGSGREPPRACSRAEAEADTYTAPAPRAACALQVSVPAVRRRQSAGLEAGQAAIATQRLSTACSCTRLPRLPGSQQPRPAAQRPARTHAHAPAPSKVANACAVLRGASCEPAAARQPAATRARGLAPNSSDAQPGSGTASLRSPVRASGLLSASASAKGSAHAKKVLE